MKHKRLAAAVLWEAAPEPAGAALFDTLPHPASTTTAASTAAARRLCFMVVLLCSQP